MNFVKSKVQSLPLETIMQCIHDWRDISDKGVVDKDSMLRKVTLDLLCCDDVSDLEYVVMACYDCIFDQYLINFKERFGKLPDKTVEAPELTYVNGV